MTLELWNTFATMGTFIVIAATAIAALVQLRHARSGNQIAALAELQAAFERPQFTAAHHWVRTGLASKVKDPEFRYQSSNSDAITGENQELIGKIDAVGNFYENLGMLTREGLIDGDLVFNVWSARALAAWETLAPVTACFRRKDGDALWENFEYFVVLSKNWLAAHPNGDYPADLNRMGLKDEFLEADMQYAASRTSA